MRTVLFYSALLLAGLLGSQVGPIWAPAIVHSMSGVVSLATMICLSYIMIAVGEEFDVDKRALGRYGWDYVVAATAAALPWILCALYFVFVMSPSPVWRSPDLWKETLLVARFSAPTSAGVLFGMLAAAGLGRTWVFRKARILAIFDDVDTVLFLIPLQALLAGWHWSLIAVLGLITLFLGAAWRYLHRWRLPVSWSWRLGYAAGITLFCRGIEAIGRSVNSAAPVRLEVLLPAFAWGALIARPVHSESAADHRASYAIIALFMVLVGLSMPAMTAAAPVGVRPPVGGSWPGWPLMAVHVGALTVLSNVGKMFCALCYRGEARFRERLAVAVAMFPRGEVGAGVLVLSLSYGLAGAAVSGAVLSLALNLVLTGVFIAIVKRLTRDGLSSQA